MSAASGFEGLGYGIESNMSRDRAKNGLSSVKSTTASSSPRRRFLLLFHSSQSLLPNSPFKSSVTMASEFRARGAKQASPPATLPPPQYQPRYPPRDHHLDADERKALAQPGSLKQSQHAFGGLRLASSEWKLLAGIVVLALCVRLYHLSWPASVV